MSATPPPKGKSELTRHTTAAAERAAAITNRRAEELRIRNPKKYANLYGSETWNLSLRSPSGRKSTHRNQPPPVHRKTNPVNHIARALNFEEKENKNRATAAAGLMKLGNHRGGSRRSTRRNRSRNRR